MHARSASLHSVRYIRGPKESGETTTDGDNYAEIDLANSSRHRARRPSDYEAVMVKNVGLMSTEALNSMSPTNLKDEVDLDGKKLGAFEMPNLHPALVGNDYESMKRAGFRSRPSTFETNMSEDESEVIRNAPALTMSGTVPNPMYTTSSSTLDVIRSPKRISESNLDNWDSPQRGSDGYSIPNKVKRPSIPSDTLPLGADGQTNGVVGPSDLHQQPNVIYNIPTMPAQRNNNVSLISFSPMTSSEDLTRENRTHPNGTAPTNYRHPNHVLYNIPTMPVQDNGNAPAPNSLQTNSTSNGTTGSGPLLYDVPPNRTGVQPQNVDSNSPNNGNVQSGTSDETYEKPKSGSMGSLLYDVPTSTEKLDSSVIPGTGSSELTT